MTSGFHLSHMLLPHRVCGVLQEAPHTRRSLQFLYKLGINQFSPAGSITRPGVLSYQVDTTFTSDSSSLCRTEHQAGLWDGVDDPHFKGCGHGDGRHQTSKAPVIAAHVHKRVATSFLGNLPHQFSTWRFLRHDCELVSCPVKSHSRVRLRSLSYKSV